MPTRTTARRRYTPEEIQAFRERKERLDQVYQISLVDFARSQNVQMENGDRDTYHVLGLPEHCGGLYIFKSGKGYVWFSQVEPPYKRDILGFAKEYFGARDDEAAIDMVLGCRSLSTYSVSPKYVEKPKGPIVVPDKAPDFNRAIAYLIKTRGIDKEIVYEMIKQGRVYQSIEHKTDKETGEYKGTYQNICFVGFDEKGAIRSGAMRSMSEKYRFRQDFENNDKSYGFAMPGISRRLYVFEAPIDAMSHATLFKLQGADWRQDHRLSEGGLSDRALAQYLKMHPEIDEIIWCFDNDLDGVDKSGKPQNHGQLAAEKYKTKYEKKYRTRIDTPVENDVNQDLKVFRGWVKPSVRVTAPAPVHDMHPPAVPAPRQEQPEADEGEEWDGWEP